MISIIEQQTQLIEIGNRLPKEMVVYAIGGTAMMFFGFKEATKDVDLVFTSYNDRKIFLEITKSLGYKEMNPVVVYGEKTNIPIMVSLKDFRLDLFLNDVISFTFSETVQKRAEQIHKFGKNLILRIADKHDIILMKCATSRINDEIDIINIIKNSNINWNILIEESKVQVSLGRERVFLEMGSLLENLIYKHKLDIPKKIGDIFFELLKEQANQKKKEYDSKK